MLGTFRWRRDWLPRLAARVAELAVGASRGRLAVDLGEPQPWGEIRFLGQGVWAIRSAGEETAGPGHRGSPRRLCSYSPFPPADATTLPGAAS